MEVKLNDRLYAIMDLYPLHVIISIYVLRVFTTMKNGEQEKVFCTK